MIPNIYIHHYTSIYKFNAPFKNYKAHRRMNPSKQPELFRPIRPDQATRTNCSKVNCFNFLFDSAVNLQVFRDEKTCFYFSKILRDVHHICRRFPTAWLHLATIILFFWLLGWEMGDIWVEKWACQQCWTTNKWCFAKSMLHHFTSSLACPASTPSSLAFALRHPIASRRPLDELMAGNPTQQCRVSPKLCHFQGVGCISDGNGCLKGHG